MKYSNVKVLGVLDRDKGKAGTELLAGIRIHHTDEIGEIIQNPSNSFIIVNVASLGGLEYMELFRIFSGAGIENFYIMSEDDRREVNAVHAISHQGRIGYYKNHGKELEDTFAMLSDEESRDTLTEYIRTFVESGVYGRVQCDGRAKYFFGKLTENGYERLYKHLGKNEVWLNCGANIGDSIFLFFAQGLHAKRIYAYEGDAGIYRTFLGNLNHLPDEYRNSVTAVNARINRDADFEKWINEKITLINADIEGGEMELLESTKHIIVHDRPVVAVCVYHREDDLVRIPRFFSETVTGYIYKLRKYEAGAGAWNRSSELVLYAIPKERALD